MTKTLFCFGFGYSAAAVARLALLRGWRVIGTTRSLDKGGLRGDRGFTPIVFDGQGRSPSVAEAVRRADAILVSVAPGEAGDPVLVHHGRDLGDAPWIGYLSTVGVYGDHGGAWVDEDTAPRPVSQRSLWRLDAEAAWEERARKLGFALDIFRLAGIYGPGRNLFGKLVRGEARALVKPGQVFNRIHVADIAAAALAGLERPGHGGRTRIVNVSDDEPAPPQVALWHAADLAGLPRPPAVDFQTADLSPMARSFYGECKRVSNARLRNDLGVRLRFPTYREGLGALWAAGEADA